jgi:hypothetical protein
MKLDTFKLVTGFVVGSGVGKITSAIINNNIVPQTNLQKVIIAAGKIGIGLTAGAIVVKHVDSQIDEYAHMYKTVATKVAEAKIK